MPDIDFVSFLPPEKREPMRRRIEAERVELARLHGLPDRWLGEAVLRLARDVRSKVPGIASQAPDRRTASGYLLWDAIPEMARRLGCATTPNEARGRIAGASAWDLRIAVSHAISGLDRAYLSEAADRSAALCPVSLLTRDIANGSPVAVLLDRVAPPEPEAQDRCAAYVREISTVRGLEPREAWDPTMQHYGRHAAPPVDAVEDAPSPGLR